MRNIKQELKNELISTLFDNIDQEDIKRIEEANKRIDEFIENNSVPIKLSARGNTHNIEFIKFCKLVLGDKNVKLMEYQMINVMKYEQEKRYYNEIANSDNILDNISSSFDLAKIDIKSVAKETDVEDINKISKTHLKRLIRKYKCNDEKRNYLKELKNELKTRR